MCVWEYGACKRAVTCLRRVLLPSRLSPLSPARTPHITRAQRKKSGSYNGPKPVAAAGGEGAAGAGTGGGAGKRKKKKKKGAGGQGQQQQQPRKGVSWCLLVAFV